MRHQTLQLFQKFEYYANLGGQPSIYSTQDCILIPKGRKKHVTLTPIYNWANVAQNIVFV